MKFKSLLFTAAGLLTLSACSNDDAPESTDSEYLASGYIALKINLPSTPVSRAANDDFDDGTDEEYAIADGAIVLFKGANEKDAQFEAAYNITDINADIDADNDNITSSFIKTQKVKDVTMGADDNLYALVMLNYQDVASITDTDLYIGAEKFSGNFSTFLEKTSNANFYRVEDGKATYFFMTNSPVSNDVMGGEVATAPDIVNVTTLAKLSANKDGKGPLFDTVDEAKANVAASIFVERATAKATLQLGTNANGASFGTANAEEGDGLFTVESAQWAIHNSEASSYIVRNMGDGAYMGYASTLLTPTNYRFVGSAPIGTTVLQPVTTLYRTYWCIDPAYSTPKTYEEAAPVFSALTNPLYCHENTFTVANQSYKNTTRAVLKVTFKNGDNAATFYTLNGNDKILYKTLSDVQSKGNKWIAENVLVTEAVSKALHTGSVNVSDYLTIGYAERDSKGMIKVNSIKFKTISDTEISETDVTKQWKSQPELTAAEEARLIALVNDFYQIAAYENGACYYELRFKHFAGGDKDLAPWSSNASVNTTTEAYGTSEANYLGRYGMVRNNWYDVNIIDIKHLGSPVVPDAKVDTSDDNQEVDKYLSFTVNILSWAKRVQSFEF